MPGPNLPVKVLVPDGEQFHLTQILNCFADSGGIRLFVLSSQKYTHVRYSRNVDTFIYFPTPKADIDWIEKVNQVCKAHQIDVLMPIFEKRIRTLIAFRDRLLLQNRLLVPPTLESFDSANDKGLLADFMERIGIPSPKSRLLNDPADLVQFSSQLTFPILAKPPLDTGSGDGIVKFDDENELLNTALDCPMVLQEFIEGFDTGCNVLCRDGEILAYTIQKGFLYSKKPYSPQIGLTMLYNDRVLEIVRPLMASLGWTGVANIDLIFDIRAEQYKVLEINPRYWSTLVASMMAGVNYPWLYCITVLGDDFTIPEYRTIRYFNLKGMISAIKSEPKLLFSGKFLWFESPLKYTLKDPVPMIYRVFSKIKDMLLQR